MALLERGWLENHVDVDDQVVGPFVIRERSPFGYEVTRLKTKVVGPFVIRERPPFCYEVTRLFSKSEGLEAQGFIHFIHSMILH